MRRYTDEEERTIRVGRLAHEWVRSGLLDAAQYARLAPGFQVGLRRTNVFLRVTLFGFGIVIIAAAIGLVVVTAHVREAASAAAVCIVGAIASGAAAEFLVARFRLYRFGIEEACAASAVVLFAMAAGIGMDSWSNNWQLHAGIVGAAAAFTVYRRFGYVYAAVAAMACAALGAFAVGESGVVHHALAAAILTACVVLARTKYRQHGDDFPGDEYGALEAVGVLGVYWVLNLQLWRIGRGSLDPPFYWFTYGLIWVIPVAALVSAVRDRHRLLLDASLAMALVTLVTNKSYLGLAHREWDPALLGVFLIGAALGLRRWLASGVGGMRRGVTGRRILRAEKDRVALVSMASGFQDAPMTTYPDAPVDPFAGGGGRAGGGGAEGSF